MFPLQDERPVKIFPFWTLAIIAINIYVFYLEVTSINPELFVQNYALIPSFVNFFKPETLAPFITSQFIHGGLLHIISNMWFLWIFGDNVEEKLGFLIFPIFYLVSGVSGGILQYFFIPDSNIPMIGASGAVAGILGAYFALFPHVKVKTFLFFTIVSIPASIILFYWFITQLFSGAASLSASASVDIGGVAWFAHVGGFVIGWLVGKLRS